MTDTAHGRLASGRRKAGLSALPTLNRERIVEVAIALIDARGLNALSMRDLGRDLGSSTMAVYRYFDSKERLLGAIIDHVVGAFEPDGIDGDWAARAKAMSLRVRATMLAHPELADLIGREFRRSPTSLRVNAHMIEELEGAGVPPAMLARVYWTISSYTTGYALLEAQVRRRARTSGSENTKEARARKLAEMMRPVDGISPQALALVPDVLAQPLDEAQFLFGLECLLAGLAHHLAAQGDEAQSAL